MSSSSEFWDKVSRKYANRSVPSQEIYQEKLRRTQKLFQKDSTVMEFGCGTGTTSLIHAEFVKNITAYDYSSQMILIANEKKKIAQIENVSFEVMAIEDIPKTPDAYDVIMGHSVLHLTKNNEVILKNVYDSLKHGGFFVSSSGCIKEMNFIIRKILPFLSYIGKAPEITIFSSEELINLHKKVGFKIYDIWKYKNGELFLIAQK